MFKRLQSFVLETDNRFRFFCKSVAVRITHDWDGNMTSIRYYLPLKRTDVETDISVRVTDRFARYPNLHLSSVRFGSVTRVVHRTGALMREFDGFNHASPGPSVRHRQDQAYLRDARQCLGHRLARIVTRRSDRRRKSFPRRSTRFWRKFPWKKIIIIRRGIQTRQRVTRRKRHEKIVSHYPPPPLRSNQETCADNRFVHVKRTFRARSRVVTISLVTAVIADVCSARRRNVSKTWDNPFDRQCIQICFV